MTSLTRHIVWLVSAVALFIIALGALLGTRYLALGHLDRYNSEFLIPSQARLTRADRSLIEVQSSVYRESVSSRGPSPIPFRFELEPALEGVEEHLLELARLAHTHDHDVSFDLPSRAHEQFDSARAGLRLLHDAQLRDPQHALSLLEPLKGTLAQLERIYEIEQKRWFEERRALSDRSFKLFIAAVALLTLLGIPLILQLSLRLGQTLRRERRANRALEETKQDLEILALTDSLTGLGNRNLFRARLAQALELTRRSGRVSALLYIDLDNFKRINDSLGHDAGDEVLKIMARRLQKASRASDTLARLGGDEFTVVLCEMSNVSNVSNVASITAKLLQAMAQPMRVAGTELVVTASMGITMMPADGDDPAVLMKNADMALYKAKEHGRNGFQFFVEDMNRAMNAQLRMESALRTAIRERAFTLHYQPQIDLGTGHVLCVEALLRWPQKDGSMIPPDEFIPLADATGLLTEIGGLVLEQACQDLSRFRRDTPGLRVSINLSPGQFRESTLTTRIEQALLHAGLEPSALEVEITESTLIEDVDATIATLDALRRLGITIAVDDFGVGYSSLNYLKQLPIDILKIDRSFVRDIQSDETDRSIVDAVLAMARSLGLQVVAEGIESRWQLEHLSTRKCPAGQGFLFSRPVPAHELDIPEITRRWSSTLGNPARQHLHLVD